ncbi:MAG TPA: hypothetical protein VMU08_16625 [Rhizomicrobium sp.]|nr:hypothetical protein [Rhizomicrobium sp.]
MAGRPSLVVQNASPAPDAGAAAELPVAHLARMHAEAIETARLANLLGRALYVAIALPLMAVLTVVLAGGTGVPATVAWAILIAVASLAVARAYAHAIGQPFERAVLRAFAQDLNACLLYAGCSWGAGAFLAIAHGAPSGVALLFASVPAVVVMALLRERQSVLLFLAPVAALTSLACLVRPFASGALTAALVLVACAVVAAVIALVSRRAERQREAGLPHGLFAS